VPQGHPAGWYWPETTRQWVSGTRKNIEKILKDREKRVWFQNIYITN
jgi:hypothetical protein